MTPVLECVLAVFLIVLIIVLVVLTIFAVKFLQEITLTMMSIKELSDLTKKELAPALISLNQVLKTVSNVSNATNKQFELVKKILTTLLGASCVAFTNVRGKGGFFSGLISGFNMFRKKGDKKCQ
ncbi:MAG: hypothetical protein LUH11_00755 [Candidatus Gastranaerophilales bacterium]|nr:hypothetical protein [Candidatus Gastranaerophilales bacterium]